MSTTASVERDLTDGRAEGGRSHPLLAAQAIAVAQRHYVQRQSKTAIAHEMGLSRFKVARLVEHAVEQGFVRFTVSSPTDLELAEGLVARYPRLEHAVVLAAGAAQADDVRRAIGQLAADVLAETLRPTDVLGIAWGRTLELMVAALGHLPPCSTVQLAGTMVPQLSWGPQDLARRVAAATRGVCYPLYAPLLVADEAVARSLRQESTLASTLAMFDRVEVAVVGVGAWKRGGSSLLDLVGREDRTVLRRAGVVADVGACLLDTNGNIVTDLESRMLGMRGDQLRRVRCVIGVAAGEGKVQAIGAALRSGLLTALVTDAGAAQALLDAAPPRKRAHS